jgi:hypothetical protein
VPCDVFKEEPARIDFSNNSCDVRPEVPRIGFTEAFSSLTERLARVAANDAIHDTTPRLAVEGFEIRPNRRFIQELLFHAVAQDEAAAGFDFNSADDASIRHRSANSEFESPASGAEAEHVEGR